MKECVFCKIIAGEIPCDRIYEDNLVLAFLDIAPISLGHTLIIPKEHHNSSTTLSTQLAARIMDMAPKIGVALMRVTGCDGFNLMLSNGACAGQVVPHVHMHIIPRKPNDHIVFPVGQASYESSEQKAGIIGNIRKRLES